MRERAFELGHSEADADELASICSGHSLRAGFYTPAAIAGNPNGKSGVAAGTRQLNWWRVTCARLRSGRIAD